MKAAQHESTRQRIIQQLTPPTSHVDEHRVMPTAQLAQLSDADLVNQALLVITANNPEGIVDLADGSRVVNATSRGCNAIRKQLREHRVALREIELHRSLRRKEIPLTQVRRRFAQVSIGQ